MSPADIPLLLAAGFGAGLTGSIAGLASLISYPALLAMGLSPISANVTNTIALVFSAAGSVHGSRPELSGQSHRLRALGLAGVVGGLAGGVLLLATPSGAFARLVPWLIGLASLAILHRPRPAPSPGSAGGGDGDAGHAGNRPDAAGLSVATFTIAVYGGYFGAAAGVLLLALLLATTGETLARANATKNVVLGAANATAAVVFMIFGPVRWAAVAPLAAGFLVGGRLGPLVVRRAPTNLLRAVIGLAGVGLAVHLGLDAY